MKRWTVGLAVLVALLGVNGVEGALYTYTKIADSTGPFSNFLFQITLPAINDHGDAAFYASLDFDLWPEYGWKGVFTGPDPATDTIAHSAFGSPFSDFGPSGILGASPAINSSGTVAFNARLRSGGLGIFTGPDPATDTVVDTNGPSGTFTGPFSSFGSPSLNDNGMIAFFAVLQSGESGIFTGPDPTTDTVADTSGPYTHFRQSPWGSPPSINNNGEVAFTAQLGFQKAGIFTGPDPSADTVVDTDGPFAESLFAFGGISMNNDGTVAFYGATDTFVPGYGYFGGIFTGPDPATDNVAVSSAFVPESFERLYGPPSINDSGLVAFTAADVVAGNLANGIYTGPDRATDKVIAAGDSLFGSTVFSVAMGAEGLNNSGQIAFRYQFRPDPDNPANDVYGFAIASPYIIPEPSSFIIWSLLGVLGITVGWWRRRRAA